MYCPPTPVAVAELSFHGHTGQVCSSIDIRIFATFLEHVQAGRRDVYQCTCSFECSFSSISVVCGMCRSGTSRAGKERDTSRPAEIIIAHNTTQHQSP